MKKNKINQGHFLEAMDRLHLITDMMDRHLMDHPVIHKNKDLEKLINFSIINLIECYQRVGNLSNEYDTKKKNNKTLLGRREESKNRGLDRC
jgi:hypothetical protein